MLRDDSIHIGRATRRALFFLPHSEDVAGPDAWADLIIREWLEAFHPDIVAHVKAQEEADEALRESKRPKLLTADERR